MFRKSYLPFVITTSSEKERKGEGEGRKEEKKEGKRKEERKKGKRKRTKKMRKGAGVGYLKWTRLPSGLLSWV